MDKYEILSIVGEGSFGRVYKAKNKATDEIVALKLITKCGRTVKELTSLRRECEILQNLHHPNIIRMLDSFETENEISVVAEFASKDLAEILSKEGYLPEEKAQLIICDLVSALYYLHSHRVLHRDLKPQNVLLSSDGVAKLCDFGFARNMSLGTHVLTSIKGTPLYMAPELMEESPYDHSADLWSLGCIAYEMLVGAPPFTTTSILHLVRLIRHEPIRWPDFLSSDCQSLLKGLLNKDPNQRLSWPNLLEHPFLKGNILMLSQEGGPTSLTTELTSSQVEAKEIQKQEILKIAQANMDQGHSDLKAGATNLGKLKKDEKEDCGEPLNNLDDAMKNICISKQCNIPTAHGLKIEEEWRETFNLEDSQQSPVEAEEWLVFLQQSMEEIMEGDIESINQPGFVTMVSRALSSPSATVVEYVASLLSLPMVAQPVSQPEIKKIRKVYQEVQIIPKLVYAIKLLAKRSDSESNLNAEKLQAMESIFVLITNLVYSENAFLEQFCNSVALFSMTSHLSKMLGLRRRKLRLATDLVAIFCHILRELPENASLIEDVIKCLDDPESELRALITHESDCLKIRTLALLKLMAKYCCQVLQSVWSDGFQNDIEALSYESSKTVKSVSEDAITELKKLPFYIKQPSHPT